MSPPETGGDYKGLTNPTPPATPSFSGAAFERATHRIDCGARSSISRSSTGELESCLSAQSFVQICTVGRNSASAANGKKARLEIVNPTSARRRVGEDRQRRNTAIDAIVTSTAAQIPIGERATRDAPMSVSVASGRRKPVSWNIVSNDGITPTSVLHTAMKTASHHARCQTEAPTRSTRILSRRRQPSVGHGPASNQHSSWSRVAQDGHALPSPRSS